MYTKLPNFLIQFCGFDNFKKSPFYYQTTHFPSLAMLGSGCICSRCPGPGAEIALLSLQCLCVTAREHMQVGSECSLLGDGLCTASSLCLVFTSNFPR